MEPNLLDAEEMEYIDKLIKNAKNREKRRRRDIKYQFKKLKFRLRCYWNVLTRSNRKYFK